MSKLFEYLYSQVLYDICARAPPINTRSQSLAQSTDRLIQCASSKGRDDRVLYAVVVASCSCCRSNSRLSGGGEERKIVKDRDTGRTKSNTREELFTTITQLGERGGWLFKLFHFQRACFCCSGHNSPKKERKKSGEKARLPKIGVISQVLESSSQRSEL